MGEKQPHSIILPPPCLIVGMVFLELNASPSHFQTYGWSLWPNNSIFFFFLSFIGPEFSSKAFPLSVWSAANFSWALSWRRGFFIACLTSSLTVTQKMLDCGDCHLSAASDSLQTCFWLTLDHPDQFCLSRRWKVKFSSGSWQWQNCAMHFIPRNSCLYSWSWDL